MSYYSYIINIQPHLNIRIKLIDSNESVNKYWLIRRLLTDTMMQRSEGRSQGAGE